MVLFEELQQRKEKISVIGLGYVGLPLAIELAKKYDVIGLDLNKEKLNMYKQGIDVTEEVGDKEIKETTMEFTYDENDLQRSKFHIVAVPKIGRASCRERVKIKEIDDIA